MNHNLSKSQEPRLVSIVTPVYNSAKYLSETIQSVLSQTYQSWEMLIVIDSKSNDSSIDIALEMEKSDNRIRVFADHSCQGVSQNRNYAIDQSRGEYIAFLDSDDQWMPTKLEKQVRAMQEQKARFTYHSYLCISEGTTLARPTRLATKSLNFDDLLKDNSIGCLSVMLRKDFLGTRRFESLRHEDFYLWLTLLKDGNTAIPLSEPLASYRVSSGSLSGNKLKSAIWRWQVYRKFGVSLPLSIAYMFSYVANAVRKRI